VEGQGALENSQATMQGIRGSENQGDQEALDHQDRQLQVLDSSSWTVCLGDFRRLLQGRVPPLSTENIVHRKKCKINSFFPILGLFLYFCVRPASF
jgi:hypothetical protein